MANNNARHSTPKSSPITRGKEAGKKSFRRRTSDAPIWDAVPPALLHAIVCACCTANANPTFSYTRDGTALCLAVYFDGERYVDYLADQDEVAAYFDWLLDELLNLPAQDVIRLRQARL